eukprot:9546591-Heterocapsa_arctica.AAC.1
MYLPALRPQSPGNAHCAPKLQERGTNPSNLDLAAAPAPPSAAGTVLRVDVVRVRVVDLPREYPPGPAYGARGYPPGLTCGV